MPRVPHGPYKVWSGTATAAPCRAQVVEIENTRTLTVRSFITQGDGKYHFQELNTDVDYRIRAMLDGVFGPPKNLSRFQSRKEATVNLKIGL
jgi:hypothetical protein